MAVDGGPPAWAPRGSWGTGGNTTTAAATTAAAAEMKERLRRRVGRRASAIAEEDEAGSSDGNVAEVHGPGGAGPGGGSDRGRFKLGSRKRPLIYVYDLPPDYNSRLLQYKIDSRACSWRTFQVGSGWRFRADKGKGPVHEDSNMS